MSYFARGVPSYILKHLVERKAQEFRAYLGVGVDEPVDSFQIADWLGIDVEYLQELSHLRGDICQLLLQEDHWSGMTCHLPNGIVKVVLNPTHSARRQQATLMEEIAHIHLDHEPSVIALDEATGLLKRTYDRRHEEEAYLFGSAVLVPKGGLRALYKQGCTPDSAATHYGVSRELIVYRTNLHGMKKLVK